MKKFLLFFILALSLVSCSQVSSPPWMPSSQKLEKLFTAGEPAGGSQPAAVSEIQVYLDASASMSGFLTTGSVFSRILRELTSSPEAVAKTKFYQFGETVIPVAREQIWAKASQQNFYNQRWTAFASLLNRKMQSAPKSTMFLVITDGVQSLKEGYDLSRMVQSLADGLRRGWQVEILGFKSQFEGKIYSELNDKLSFSYRTGNKAALYRPFYFFVFAPSRQALQDFNQLLGKASGLSFNLLNPGLPVVEKYRAKTLPPTEPMILFKRDSFPQGVQLVPVDYLAVLEPAKVREKIFTVDTALDFLKVSPLYNGQSRLRARVSGFYSPDDQKWTPLAGEELLFEPEFTPVTPKAPSSSSRQPEEKPLFSYRVSWHFNIPEKAGWYVYRISYLPEIGSPAFPQWVNKWSTDNDQSPVYANRTLYFSQLVELLLNQITIEQPVGEHYIAIYWGGK